MNKKENGRLIGTISVVGLLLFGICFSLTLTVLSNNSGTDNTGSTDKPNPDTPAGKKYPVDSLVMGLGAVDASIEKSEVGSTVTVSFEPGDHYTLTSYTIKTNNSREMLSSGTFSRYVGADTYVGGTYNGLEYNVDITQVDGGVSVTAIYEKIMYPVNISPSKRGTAYMVDDKQGDTASDSMYAEYGSTVYIKMTPNTGFKAAYTSSIYDETGKMDTESDTMVTNDGDSEVVSITQGCGLMFTPSYEINGKALNLSINDDTKGIIKILNKRSNTPLVDGEKVGKGDILQITATPRIGYKISSFKINGVDEITTPTTEKLVVDYLTESAIYLDVEYECVTLTVKRDLGYKVGDEEQYLNDYPVTYDDEYDLTTPTRAGYTFDGWAYESNIILTSNSEWTASPTDCTVVAKWTPLSYGITVNQASNGTIKSSNDAQYTDDTYNVTLTPDSGYSVESYTINGKTYYSNYYKSTNVSFVSDFTVEKGKAYTVANIKQVAGGSTVTGTFVANEYTITLKDEVKGKTFKEFKQTYDQAITAANLPESVEDVTGYKIVWKDSDGNIYKNGDTYKTADDITLSASYELNEYKMTLDLNGGIFKSTGTKGPVEVNVKYGEKLSFKEDPKKDGYTFGGWFDLTDVDSTTGKAKQYKNDDTWTKTKSATLTASWTANKYTITFFLNGAETPASIANQDVTYGESWDFSSLGTPTKYGYTFVGWAQTQGDIDASKNPNLMSGSKWTILSDITLIAIWTKNTTTT